MRYCHVILLLAVCFDRVLNSPAVSHRLSHAVQDQKLQKLVTDFHHWSLREFPESATLSGIHDYDDRLESFTDESAAKRKESCEHFLQSARSIAANQLVATDRLTLNVFINKLEMYISGYEWKDYGWINPVSFLDSFYRTAHWMRDAEFLSEADYAKYRSRLIAYLRQIDEVINLMEKGMALNRTNHAVSMEGVVQEIHGMASCPLNQSAFYIPYGSHLDNLSLPNNVKLNIRSEGSTLISSQVQPALKRLANFIQDRYMHKTRPGYGVGSMPNGGEYYKALLRWYLSVDLTPAELHVIGQSEVERILMKMKSIAARLGFTGSLSEFFQHLRRDRRHYNHTEEEYLQLFRRAIDDRILPRLGDYFDDLTSIPYLKVQRTPTDGIAAMYNGTLMTNTRRPETRPSFDVMVLALHEGFPGHHLQVSISNRGSLPDFRATVTGSRRFAAPFAFPYYTAYVEGWGLYAEYVGEELKLFKDDYELFGRYSYEMVRACRLVIDTGIHNMSWSREKAVDYMSNLTYMTRGQVEIEVDRYITMPGQACAYKIGEIKILDIRRKAQSMLGAQFDIRAFHTALLDLGPVSLEIMESYMNDWITQQLTEAQNSTSNIQHPSTVCTFLLMINVLSIFTL